MEGSGEAWIKNIRRAIEGLTGPGSLLTNVVENLIGIEARSKC